MLSEVDISLGIGAIVVSLISWKNPRGIVWIWVAALSYVNATIAWRMNLPYAEAITALGDVGVCLAVYFACKERWELAVWRLYQTSVAISIFYLAGNIHVFPVIAQIPHDVYSIMMEGVNWLLLLLITGISVLKLVEADASDVGALGAWHRVRRFGLSLRRRRKTPSFLTVR